MNSYEKDYAIMITEKLLRDPLSIAFIDPIPADAEWAPAYFSIIKEPMDLSTVSNKLNSGKYQNIEQWKREISLIWSNGMTFNEKRSLIYTCAEVLDEKCQKWFSRIPKSQEDIIKNQYNKINNKIQRLLYMDMPEYSIAPRDPIHMH